MMRIIPRADNVEMREDNGIPEYERTILTRHYRAMSTVLLTGNRHEKEMMQITMFVVDLFC